MDSLLDRIEDMGVAPKLTLLLLLAVFVSILAFQFVVAPQHQRAQAFHTALQSLDHRLAAMNRPSDSMASLHDEMDALTPRVEAQKKLLGIHMPIDHLLPEIADTAQSAGVTLTSWQPEEPRLIPEMHLHRVVLRLDAEGRYHALARFLEALRGLPKALIVRSMDYRVRTEGAEDPKRDIQASFELVGFQASARVGQRDSDRAAAQG